MWWTYSSSKDNGEKSCFVISLSSSRKCLFLLIWEEKNKLSKTSSSDCHHPIFLTLLVPHMSSHIWGLWDITPLLVKWVFFWFVIICESSVDLHWILETLLVQKNSATCIFRMYMEWFTVLTGGWLDQSVTVNKMFSTARMFPGALDYYKACWYL